MTDRLTLLVHGGGGTHRARYAAHHYGEIRKIRPVRVVASGAPMTASGRTEAQQMYSTLRKEGVNHADIELVGGYDTVGNFVELLRADNDLKEVRSFSDPGHVDRKTIGEAVLPVPLEIMDTIENKVNRFPRRVITSLIKADIRRSYRFSSLPLVPGDLLAWDAYQGQNPLCGGTPDWSLYARAIKWSREGRRRIRAFSK